MVTTEAAREAARGASTLGSNPVNSNKRSATPGSGVKDEEEEVDDDLTLASLPRSERTYKHTGDEPTHGSAGGSGTTPDLQAASGRVGKKEVGDRLNRDTDEDDDAAASARGEPRSPGGEADDEDAAAENPSPS